MKVYVDESPAGLGKTYRASDRVMRSACKVLVITERKHSFEELEQVLRDAGIRHSTRPIIRHIHGDLNNREISVAKEIEAVPDLYTMWQHVVIIATHAALLRSDFSRFAGWEIVVDEVPAFLDFEEKDTHLDRDFFDRYYTLTPKNQKWHSVGLTENGRSLAVADVRADQSHAHLGVFHARVVEADRPNSKREVLCNLPNWDSMTDRKVRWCWASIFSLKQLEAFNRVELLGNRFRDNIGSVLTQSRDGDDVEWVALPPLSQTRQFTHRTVEITYFTDRPAGRAFFETAGGQRALTEIGRHLSTVLPVGNSIWTANATARFGELSPKTILDLPVCDFVAPKQAGTNRYQGISHAAMIYTAKPCPNLISLLRAFDIDPEIWTRSIEYEAILQFMTRTSVRDPANATTVRLWVFDQGQARYLKDYFDALPHVSASLTRSELVIEIPARATGGRPPMNRTPEQQEAYNVERRRRNTQQKREARRKAA